MGGFTPIRRRDSSSPFSTTRYPVAASAAYYVGDAVRASGGVVKPTIVSASQPLGVVARLYDANGTPFTHQLPPGAIPRKPAGISGFADVYDDPGIVYAVDTETSVSAGTGIGSVYRVVASAGNTDTGRSGHTLASTASAGAGQFRLIRAYQDIEDAAPTRAEVVMTRGLLQS